MVAPQDPQRGRLARAAAFSTWASADALAKITHRIASMNLVLDRITSPLSSGVEFFASRQLRVYASLRPTEPSEPNFFSETAFVAANSQSTRHKDSERPWRKRTNDRTTAKPSNPRVLDGSMLGSGSCAGRQWSPEFLKQFYKGDRNGRIGNCSHGRQGARSQVQGRG